MAQDHSVVVCAVGLKGAAFLEGLRDTGVRVDRIVSYPQPGDASDGFERIRALADAAGIPVDVERRPAFAPQALVFMVGWQYLVPASPATVIVFHDSLLPRLRGFAPTVTALILGHETIGVSALRPVEEVDAGPLAGQAGCRIAYPIKIAAALEIQARLMVELAGDVAGRFAAGTLAFTPQSETEATYSIWRDAADYWIDWTSPADEIARLVDAVGFPYDGARTSLAGETLVIDDAAVVPDLHFAIRTPGKIWRFDDGRPVVVCGQGLLRLDRCRTASGEIARIDRLRTRLGG